MAESAQEHLLNHLRDTHAVELQALRQFARAAQGREDEEERGLYEEELEQTRSHEERVKKLVESLGHSPSAVEDKTLRGGTIGLRQLADIALDTPVKLTMNLFALDHLEIAAFELLAEIAKAAEEEDTAQGAQEILEQKRQTAEKLAETFDRAAEQLMEDADGDALLLSHLSDIHGIEQQSMQLIRIGIETACEDEQLKSTYCSHLEETEEHERLIKERIEAREAKPSAVRDLHMAAAKAGLHDLTAHPPDANVKVAMNLYCVEHLEVAAYELLARIAERAGDKETAEVAQKICKQEREAAEALQDNFAHAVELMLQSDASYDSVRAAESPEEGESSPADSEADEGSGDAAQNEQAEGDEARGEHAGSTA